MPRIRTLKPEALQHRKVGALSDRAFRLWVGAITQADDEGRLVVDPEQLRVLVFGYHQKVTSRDVASAREELRAAGLIRIYSVSGSEYADFPSWRDHQRVDHPTPSKLPSYEESMRAPEDSRALAKTLAGSEGIGSEGIGSETTLSGSKQPTRTMPSQSTEPRDIDAARDVLAHLILHSRRSFRYVPANLDLIQARLKGGITVAQLKAVVDLKVKVWAGDLTMSKYIRPKTLFNRTNCEQYIGELISENPQPDLLAGKSSQASGLLLEFGHLYEAKIGHPYVGNDSRDLAVLDGLLVVKGVNGTPGFTPETLRRMMAGFFRFPPQWVREKDCFTIPAFKGAFPELTRLLQKGEI